VKEAIHCYEANFETRDEKAYVTIGERHLPNYSSTALVAFDQITEDFSGNYSFEDVIAGTVRVRVVSSKAIDHKGQNALHQTLEFTPEYTFLYCTERATRLTVLNPRWSSSTGSKYVQIFVGGACKTDFKNLSEMGEILDTFQPWK